MFAIDLLKGKALPEQIDLKKSILKGLLILIPVLAVTALATSYHRDNRLLTAHKQTLAEQQQQIGQYSNEVAEYNALNKQIKDMEKCLKDIDKALSYRIQVSDTLIALTDALPEPIFIYEIKMDRNSQMEKVQNENSGEFKQRLMITRKLKLVLCGYDPDQSDQAVQEYIEQLEISPLLSEIFTEIKPSMRNQGQVNEKDAIFYEIECVLAEQR